MEKSINKFIAWLVILEEKSRFMIISTILTIVIFSISIWILVFPIEKTFASHIDQRKWAVLDEYSLTELQGIIAEADEKNGDIFLSPDPNYYNLLFGGNVIEPFISDHNSAGDTYPRWKGLQDNLDSCQLPASYQKPYPLVRLELYGFDGYNAGPNSPSQAPWLPIVDGDYVKKCDHISVRGLYVIDHGHTMYTGDGMTPSFCICCDYDPNNRQTRICYPHAELHPYQWESVKLIKPLPANIFNPNVETHTVALPVYGMFYGEEKTCILSWCYWDCVYPSEGGYCGQVLDNTRLNEWSIEWHIQAGPYPSPGQCGVRSGDRCEIKYQEDVVLKTGLVSTQITPESGGIHVQVNATAPAGSDYVPLPDTGVPGSYKLKFPTQYIAKYSVWWVPPTGPPPPPQEQQPSK